MCPLCRIQVSRIVVLRGKTSSADVRAQTAITVQSRLQDFQPEGPLPLLQPDDPEPLDDRAFHHPLIHELSLSAWERWVFLREDGLVFDNPVEAPVGVDLNSDNSIGSQIDESDEHSSYSIDAENEDSESEQADSERPTVWRKPSFDPMSYGVYNAWTERFRFE